MSLKPASSELKELAAQLDLKAVEYGQKTYQAMVLEEQGKVTESQIAYKEAKNVRTEIDGINSKIFRHEPFDLEKALNGASDRLDKLAILYNYYNIQAIIAQEEGRNSTDLLRLKAATKKQIDSLLRSN